MSSNPRRVVVVDRHPEEYRHLEQTAGEGQIRFLFYRSGEQALREAAGIDADLWLIQAALPDMAGAQLCRLLPRGQRVCLLADEYDPEIERTALSSGKAHFACKPLSAGWLRAALEHRSRRPRKSSRREAVAGLALTL